MTAAGTGPPTIVIADDEELVRSGLSELLQRRGVVVAATVSDGRQALRAVEDNDPDVVLMDLRMPVLDGLSATRALVQRGARARILVLTTIDVDEQVYWALRAGAAGFLLKSSSPDRLAEAVRVVRDGEQVLAPELTSRLVQTFISGPAPSELPASLAELTEREVDVLRLVARGLSNDVIARSLLIAPATVKTHINHLFHKLGLEGRAQAVVLAYESGLLRPGRDEGGAGRRFPAS